MEKAPDERVKKTLILQAPGRGILPGEGPIYLGPWCCLDRDRALAGSGAITVSIPGYTTDDLLKNAEICEKAYTHMLGVLTSTLNGMHGVKKSAAYWSVMLNPWLMFHINMMHERYVRIRAALEKYGKDLFFDPLPEIKYCAPADNYEFLDTRVGSEDYNLCLSSVILSLLIPGSAKEIAADDKGNPGIRGKSAAVSLRSMIKKTVLTLQQRLRGQSDIAMIDMLHMDFGDMTKFNTLMGGVCSLDHIFGSGRRAMPAHDIKMRSCLEFKDRDEDVFTESVKKSIRFTMPRCCVEGYADTAGQVSNIRRKPPKMILSDTGWYFNEIFKCYAAEMQEKGVKLVGVQHGGNYGFSLYHSVFAFEKENKYKFISWGWGQGRENTKDLPDPALSAIGQVSAKKNGTVLYVSFNDHVYPYSLSGYPGADGMEKYFDDQMFFLGMLGDDMKRKVRYRAARCDHGRGILARVKAVSDLIGFAGEEKCTRLMGRASIVVVDHPMTAFIEALVMNVPLLLFWDRTLWRMNEEAKRYFDGFRKAGVLFDGPAAAASQLKEVYDDPASWWERKEIQEHRERFVNRYGQNNREWAAIWVRELKALCPGTDANRGGTGFVGNKIF
ncbi:MAG TPA: LIC12162 family protein [Candidatus Omnitrophota bacterium]|nr:LIC12162 family protein [Candidatus Omnitrophota bacterium]HPS19537.1 LIC12162 family protein [Candidatus Omnitrophota bacterium]